MELADVWIQRAMLSEQDSNGVQAALLKQESPSHPRMQQAAARTAPDRGNRRQDLFGPEQAPTEPGEFP